MKTLDNIGITPAPDFERLRQTLSRRGRPGFAPFYELYVNPGVMEKLLDKKIQGRADTLEFYHRAGYDYVPAWPGLPLRRGNMGDSAGDHPIGDWRSFEAYPWPTTDDITFDEFDALAPKLPDGMKVIGQTGGIFEALESLCGYSTLCYLLCDARDLVAAILDHLEALYVAMYTGMARLDTVGALVVSDDLGFKTQTLIAPDDLRELVLPRHKKLVDIAHAHGKPCILHSCGNLQSIMDDIIGTVGIDAKHSYEDAILPVAEAKRLYGDRIAILGGFDVDRLCRSSVAEIQDYTERLLADCADGGYALGSGNSIADYVPTDNYLTMLETGWRFNHGV